MGITNDIWIVKKMHTFTDHDDMPVVANHQCEESNCKFWNIDETT